MLPVWRAGSGTSRACWGLWAEPASLWPGSPGAGSLALPLSSSPSPSLHPFSPSPPPGPPVIEKQQFPHVITFLNVLLKKSVPFLCQLNLLCLYIYFLSVSNNLSYALKKLLIFHNYYTSKTHYNHTTTRTYCSSINLTLFDSLEKLWVINSGFPSFCSDSVLSCSGALDG